MATGATTGSNVSLADGLAYWSPPIGRVVLGGLFLTAGVLKLQDPQAFLFAINGFKLLPPHLAYAAAFVIPWTEVIAGTMLILGIWGRSAAVILIALLGAFIAGILNVLINGYDTKCSCFGNVEWPCGEEVGLCQITRNILMMGFGLPVLIWGTGHMSVDAALARSSANRVGRRDP